MPIVGLFQSIYEVSGIVVDERKPNQRATRAVLMTIGARSCSMGCCRVKSAQFQRMRGFRTSHAESMACLI